MLYGREVSNSKQSCGSGRIRNFGRIRSETEINVSDMESKLDPKKIICKKESNKVVSYD
jgi:hypothetical protein